MGRPGVITCENAGPCRASGSCVRLTGVLGDDAADVASLTGIPLSRKEEDEDAPVPGCGTPAAPGGGDVYDAGTTPEPMAGVGTPRAPVKAPGAALGCGSIPAPFGTLETAFGAPNEPAGAAAGGGVVGA